MNWKLILSTILFCIFVLNSCQETTTEPTDSNLTVSGPVLFEVSFANYAWGYTYLGTYIDYNGKVFSFNICQSCQKDSPKVADHANGYYTSDELLNKYHYNDTLLKVFPKEIMEWCHSISFSTQFGIMSDTTAMGADGGTMAYLVYIFVPDSNKYKQYILEVSGDNNYHDTSSGAIKLVKWLKGGKESIMTKDHK